MITSVVFPPAIILWVLVAIYMIYSHIQRQQQIAISGIADIDRMSGAQFENYLVLLFRKDGYIVQPTPLSGDFGADLILTRNGIRTVVQAKRSSGKVNLKAVQEIVGARRHYGASEACVITNNYYQPSAVALAKSNGVELIDRGDLINLMNRINGR